MADDNREVTRLGLGQSPSPHLLAVRDDVPVEVGVRVGTPVVASPAVGMEGSDAIGVELRRIDVLRNKVLLGHADLLIDPGRGTVQEPAAGPSKGQVPQVALDEPAEIIRHRASCAATQAAYVPATGTPLHRGP